MEDDTTTRSRNAENHLPVNQCHILKGLTPDPLISTESRDEECVELYLLPPLPRSSGVVLLCGHGRLLQDLRFS
jgi:hypothetical protein